MLETLFLSHCPPVYQSISIILELPKYIQQHTGRRRIFGHTRHILEAGGRDREQIKNRSPLHQSVGLETRGGKLVDEEFGEGGGG